SAEALALVPVTDPNTALRRFETVTSSAFPDFGLLITGKRELRYPADNAVEHPPAEWKRASGLIVKPEGSRDQLYAWAHVAENGEEVTVLAPVTVDLLGDLVPGLGDVAFVPFGSGGAPFAPGHGRVSPVPQPINT